MNKYVLLLIISCPLAHAMFDDLHKGASHFEKGMNNLPKAVEKLKDVLDTSLSKKELEERGDALGQALGSGVVLGAAGAVKSGLIAVPGAAKAAVLTYGGPVAAGAAATGFAGYMGYVGWVCHRENGFNKCLSRHFDNENVNERGFPRRCDSPERRLRYWTNSVTETYIERFKTMKKRGLRPQGKWLGNDGIEDQKD